MNDTEILNAMQALVEEHFRAGGLRFDFNLGAMTFVMPEPPPIHVLGAAAAIQSGPMPDLRGFLVDNLQPHLLRLVDQKIARR